MKMCGRRLSDFETTDRKNIYSVRLEFKCQTNGLFSKGVLFLPFLELFKSDAPVGVIIISLSPSATLFSLFVTMIKSQTYYCHPMTSTPQHYIHPAGVIMNPALGTNDFLPIPTMPLVMWKQSFPSVAPPVVVDTTNSKTITASSLNGRFVFAWTDLRTCNVAVTAKNVVGRSIRWKIAKLGLRESTNVTKSVCA